MFVWPQTCTHTSLSARAVGTSVGLGVQSSDRILLLDTETTRPGVAEQDPHIHFMNERPILARAFASPPMYSQHGLGYTHIYVHHHVLTRTHDYERIGKCT